MFSKLVPVIKEKPTEPGPRQQVKVDTNVTETAYWYSPYWVPESCVSHTEHGGFPQSKCSVHSCFLCVSPNTAEVPCHFSFSCCLTAVTIGSLRICHSDILMQNQAQSDFWSSSVSPLLEISIQPLKGLHFIGCMHDLLEKIFSARFMAAHEATWTSMWVNIIHLWLMHGAH